MSLLTAYLIDAVSTDADVLRRTIQVLAGNQMGVWLAGDLKVTAGAGMVSNLAAGRGLINGTQNTVTQGAYGVTNDATISQTHAASDPTNPRNDLVGIKIEDAFYSGSNKQATAVIITGTPAASPVDPTPPANFLSLARVRVNAGSSSLGTITDLRNRLGSIAHKARAHASAGTVLTASTLTKITLGAVDSDPSGSFASSRFTVPAGGEGDYQVNGRLSLPGGASGVLCIALIYKNGAEYTRSSVNGATTATNLPVAARLDDLVAGDYIELWAFVAAGVTTNSTFPGDCSELFVTRVSRGF